MHLFPEVPNLYGLEQLCNTACCHELYYSAFYADQWLLMTREYSGIRGKPQDSLRVYRKPTLQDVNGQTTENFNLWKRKWVEFVHSRTWSKCETENVLPEVCFFSSSEMSTKQLKLHSRLSPLKRPSCLFFDMYTAYTLGCFYLGFFF